MIKYAVFLFGVLLILSVNGNATEKEIIHLVSFDNSLSVEKENHVEIKTTSEPELEQSTNAIPEPIALLILGSWLIIFGSLFRKTLLQRCLTCPLT
jgi:hypothetical protein